MRLDSKENKTTYIMKTVLQVKLAFDNDNKNRHKTEIIIVKMRKCKGTKSKN